ncbi:MAG: hypothetical protein R3Y29_07930 [bacterium]
MDEDNKIQVRRKLDNGMVINPYIKYRNSGKYQVIDFQQDQSFMQNLMQAIEHPELYNRHVCVTKAEGTGKTFRLKMIETLLSNKYTTEENIKVIETPKEKYKVISLNFKDIFEETQFMGNIDNKNEFDLFIDNIINTILYEVGLNNITWESTQGFDGKDNISRMRAIKKITGLIFLINEWAYPFEINQHFTREEVKAFDRLLKYLFVNNENVLLTYLTGTSKMKDFDLDSCKYFTQISDDSEDGLGSYFLKEPVIDETH